MRYLYCIIAMSLPRGHRQRYPEIECQYELQETLGSGEWRPFQVSVDNILLS